MIAMLKTADFADAWRHALNGGRIRFHHWTDPKVYISFNKSRGYFELHDSRGAVWPWAPTIEQHAPGLNWVLL